MILKIRRNVNGEYKEIEENERKEIKKGDIMSIEIDMRKIGG